MRILRFLVEGQTIKQDPSCDFSGLVPGSEGYLQAEFAFSSDWDGCAKVAAFFSRLGMEYEPQILDRFNRCTIPAKALKKTTFKVQVIGQKEDRKLLTNKVNVEQKGGKV